MPDPCTPTQTCFNGPQVKSLLSQPATLLCLFSSAQPPSPSSAFGSRKLNGLNLPLGHLLPRFLMLLPPLCSHSTLDRALPALTLCGMCVSISLIGVWSSSGRVSHCALNEQMNMWAGKWGRMGGGFCASTQTWGWARWPCASAKWNCQMVAPSPSVCSHFYWLRILKTGLSKYSPSPR